MTTTNKLPVLPGLQRSAAFLAAAVLSVACSGISYGQEPAHLVTGPGLAAGGLADGELLLGELNCVGCHQAPPAVKESLFVKQPPLLGHVGDRITPNYLRSFLNDPQSQKPGTQMPTPLHGLGKAARKDAIEDLPAQAAQKLMGVGKTTAAWGAFMPSLMVQARTSFSPAVK